MYDRTNNHKLDEQKSIFPFSQVIILPNKKRLNKIITLRTFIRIMNKIAEITNDIKQKFETALPG